MIKGIYDSFEVDFVNFEYGSEVFNRCITLKREFVDDFNYPLLVISSYELNAVLVLDPVWVCIYFVDED